MINFTCPTCDKTFTHDLRVIISHTDQHIIEVIKKKNPQWIEQDGICKKCYQYLKSQLPGRTINEDSANG